MRLSPALLPLLLAACAVRPMVHVDSDRVRPRPARVAVLSPVAVAELHPEEPLKSGAILGIVRFGGGAVDGAEGPGSATVEIDDTDLALTASLEHVDAALRAALAPLPAAAIAEPRLPTPTLVPRRGSRPEDGRDNQPLPAMAITLPDLSLPPGGPLDADALVGAYIVAYYAHNGGWFRGQTWGTNAGARYRVLVGTWDARSGALLGQTEIDLSLIDSDEARPSPSQLEDLLLTLETHMRRQLARHLWR